MAAGNEARGLISIVIPVYGVEKKLERCLQSVAGQTYGQFEALLIDDGSPDGSGEICEAWSRKDPRFRTYHKENGGLSDARNYGIERSRGEYLSFIDSDDTVEPGYLRYLLDLMGKAADCRISQANHRVIRGDRAEPAYGGTEAVLTPREAAEAVLWHDRVDVSAWGKLYRRSVFEEIRYPKGRLFEDTWVFAEVLAQTGSYVYGPEVQYNYEKSEGSITEAGFRPEHLGYIESAERMAGAFRAKYPELETGCRRRVNHARLSVLREMKDCGDEYLPVRQELRAAVLREAGSYLRDPRTPKRDRAAVALLRAGFGAFYAGWGAYERLRRS